MGAKMIFMTLFLVFSTVQGRRPSAPQEIHELRYIYTAFSKPSSQPGVHQFIAMGILDDKQIDYYDSKERIKKPMQKWMEENIDKDYWYKGTQSRRSKEEWFSVNLKILMERMHHNQSDLHILQWMHGCRVEKKPDGSLKLLKGYDNYAYDGADFLSFDSTHKVWVAHVPAADSTKRKWDNEPILGQYTMGYLQNDCVHWLGKYVKYQEEHLRTVPPPDVHIMAKFNTGRYTLVCLATGFYPNDVVVDIYKNGVMLAQWDGVTSSGVRPNGDEEMTFQLEKRMYIEESDTSKYSCRIQHRTLPSPIEEFWDGTCSNCGSDTMLIVPGVGALFIILLMVLIAVSLFVKHRKAHRKSATGKEAHCESEILSPAGLAAKEPKKYEKGFRNPGVDFAGGSSYDVSKPLVDDAHRRSATGEEPHCESEIPSPGLDSAGGSSDSVNKPLVGDAEGEQQPRPEASEVVDGFGLW